MKPNVRGRLPRLRPTRRQVRRNFIAGSVAVVLASLVSLVHVWQADAVHPGGPLQAVESWLEDAFQRLRTPESYGAATGRDPRTLITIVELDEPSIAALGIQRNWPRSYYATLVDRLMEAPPRVIAFDLGFFEPTGDDALLAEAFQRAQTQSLTPPVRRGTDIVIASAGGAPAGATTDTAERGADGTLRFGSGLRPVPAVAEHATLAAINALPDDKGEVRAMPLIVSVGDQQLPSLGLAATARYLRRPGFVDGRPGLNTLLLAGREIPVDANSSVHINYFGPPSQLDGDQTFPLLSFVDVLRGRADPALWRDRIVFVGLANAVGFADDYWTPVSDNGHKMAGVEIHANVAATLLSTQFVRHAPLSIELGAIWGLSLLLAFLAVNLGVLRSLLATCLILSVFVWTNLLYAFNVLGTYVGVVDPLLAAGLTFVMVTSYRVMVEERFGRAILRALASVIPPTVAQQIARDPDRVQLGGERRTVTVLFTDLKDFTSFSEKVEPEVLARVITQYLEAMTRVIFRHGGTVDKFIGDAVMAFWNAPLEDPEHARHACEAGLEMQAELRRLSQGWIAEGLPSQFMRVGISTGPASVGNMGTSTRFAYTALGDTINLGARLESLNKEYGTSVCMSQSTLDAVGGRDRFLVRFLDLVVVKGKHQPVPVYELIGSASDRELAERYREVLGAYDQAILLYQAGQFGKAADLFRVALSVAPAQSDEPSAMYLRRCDELGSAPADPAWVGVYVMRHK